MTQPTPESKTEKPVTYYTGPLYTNNNPWTPLNRCPRVRSLIAHHHEAGTYTIIPIRCKCWSCNYCAKINTEQLQKRIIAGAPNRFITLTTKPLPMETAKECYDRCRPRVSRLINQLRKRYKKFEAAIILELTKKGYPHWHLVTRSGYIPQKEISARWQKLTGAHVVDVRLIRDQDKAAKYVTKYAVKSAQFVNEHRFGRLIAFTHKFSIKEQSNSKPPLTTYTRSKRHPCTVLQTWPTICRIEYEQGVWRLLPPTHEELPELRRHQFSSNQVNNHGVFFLNDDSY